jgi:DNA-binding transcriptional MerR regulator
MRIGEIAQRGGVSRDTIRLYERQGLIRSEPAESSTNSYRDYPEDALFTLEIIRDAQAAGMTLADLTVFFGQLQAADDDFDGDAFLKAKIDEVQNRIHMSRRFLNTLRQTRRALARAVFPD